MPLIRQLLEPFSAWTGARRPRCVFIAEAWGREEEALPSPEPLVGPSGKEFWRLLGEAQPDLWPEEHRRVTSLHRFGSSWVQQRRAWMQEASVAFTNVFNLRPTDNRISSICARKAEHPTGGGGLPAIESGLYVLPEYLPQLERLFEELVETRPNLVVALGAKACWALLRTTEISKIRGTTTTAVIPRQEWGEVELKLLPTWHPAGLLYEGQWSRRPILLADLIKAAQEARFAEIRRPQRLIRVQPETIEEWESWCTTTLELEPPLLGVDTETSLGMIDTIGFSVSRSLGFSCHFRPHRVRKGANYMTVYPRRNGQQVANYWTKEEEIRFWRVNRALLESDIPKLFQNGVYDLQYFLRMHLRPKNVTEDTMLLHHSLFPEMQKGLGFLGSIYTGEASWKLMRKEADTEKRDE